MASLTDSLRLVARQQQRDRAGGQAGECLVGAAGQNDRHACAEHDAGDLRLGQILELLRQHVPGLEVGHHEDVGTAGDRRDNPFRLGRLRRHRIVEGERTVENAAGDLAAIGHLAKRGRVERGPDLLRDGLDRRENRHARLRDAQSVRQIDRILDDVALVRQRGIDVDRRVGDEERPRIVGRVDRKDVADAPGGAQAALAVDHRMHELVGMESALHQRLDLAGAGHGDGLRGRGLAVLGRDDLVRRQIELCLRGGGADLGLRTNQHRRISLARAASTAPSSEGVSTGWTTAVRMGSRPRVISIRSS